MKLNVYSVYDSKAEAFLPPFFLPMEGQALRIFQNTANNKDHDFGRNPMDYTLFKLGEFDDDNGLLVPLTTPKNLGSAEEHKNAPQIPEPQLVKEEDC